MKFVVAFHNRRGLAFANHLYRLANAVNFGIRRNERRHGVDVIAERPEPHARFANHFQDIICRGLRLEFQDANRAENAHIGRIFQRAQRFQICTQAFFNTRNLASVIAVFEQIERRNARSTSQRVRHIGRAMHERRYFAIRNRVRHLFRCNTGGHRDTSAGKRLANAHDVGFYEVGAFRASSMFHRKSRTSAVKARCNLIENQQDAFFVAKFAEPLEVARIVEPHAVSALENRLANDSRNFIFVLRDNLFHRGKIRIVPCTIKPAIRPFGKIMLRHNPAEKHMHSVRIAKCHRTRRIAVVAALQGNQLATLRATQRMLVLHRHLGGTFHGNASRICKENLIEPLRQKINQTFTQFNRRFMRKTTEHHMAHLFALLANRRNDFGGIVSMRHAPPTRNRID